MRQWLGAETVDSVDASPYENATLHPRHEPAARGRLRRRRRLRRGARFWLPRARLRLRGGLAQLRRALPGRRPPDPRAAGQQPVGHGFYQFSPELFFNLYQPRNGFELLGVWFALKAEPRYWWSVADPSAVRRRVTLRNAHEVYMMVIARKLDASSRTMAAPQQSDYAQSAWVRPASADPGAAAVGSSPDMAPNASTASAPTGSPACWPRSACSAPRVVRGNACGRWPRRPAPGVCRRLSDGSMTSVQTAWS